MVVLLGIPLWFDVSSIASIMSYWLKRTIESCYSMTWTNGSFVPHTDVSAYKMLQDARMAAMRKLHRGVVWNGQSPIKAVQSDIMLNLTRRYCICGLKRTNDDRAFSGQNIKTTSDELCPCLRFGFDDLQGRFDINTPVEQGVSN